ncbi:MAG: ROK family protein [Moorellales bacterium]
MGGRFLKAGMVRSDGRLLRELSWPTRLEQGCQGVVQQVGMAAAELLRLEGRRWEEVAGVGVGVPGTVRLPEGEVLFAPNLGWTEVPFLAALRRELPVPVAVDNDAHVAALGEYWVGAGQGYRTVLMLTLGTGVGSAFLVEGKVHRGRSGLGSELGHMTVDPNGPRCGCGNRGCLEAFLGAGALEARARELLKSGKPSRLVPEGDWGIKEVMALAGEGDPVAAEVVAGLVGYLAMGLANAVVLVDPEVIIIGGGVAAAAGVFLEELRRETARRAAFMGYPSPLIVTAALGNRAGILGAAYLVSRGAGEGT